MPTDPINLHTVLFHHHSSTTAEKRECGHALKHLKYLLSDDPNKDAFRANYDPVSYRASVIPYAVLNQPNEHPSIVNSVLALAQPQDETFTLLAERFDPADEDTLGIALDHLIKLQCIGEGVSHSYHRVLGRPVQLVALSVLGRDDQPPGPRHAHLIFGCELKNVDTLQRMQPCVPGSTVVNLRHSFLANPSALMPVALFRAAFRLVSEANPPKR